LILIVTKHFSNITECPLDWLMTVLKHQIDRVQEDH
jgi:hypothetical protein